MSILTKQTEIAAHIKQKQQERAQLKPQIKKLGKLFSFANPRQDSKRCKDQGTGAGSDSFDNQPVSG